MSDPEMCDLDSGLASGEGSGVEPPEDDLSHEAICDCDGTGADGEATDGESDGASTDALSRDAICGAAEQAPGSSEAGAEPGETDLMCGPGSTPASAGPTHDGEELDEPEREAGQGGGEGDGRTGAAGVDEPPGEPDCEDRWNWDSQGRLYKGCAPVSPMENYEASAHLGGSTCGPFESLGAAFGCIVEHFTSGGDPDPRELNQSVNRGGQLGRTADGITKPQADQAERNLQ